MPQTRSQTRAQTRKNSSSIKDEKQIMKHPKGWTKDFHYLSFGCYCGQSCPCCRAMVGDTLGACPICLNNKSLLQFP